MMSVRGDIPTAMASRGRRGQGEASSANLRCRPCYFPATLRRRQGLTHRCPSQSCVRTEPYDGDARSVSTRFELRKGAQDSRAAIETHQDLRIIASQFCSFSCGRRPRSGSTPGSARVRLVFRVCSFPRGIPAFHSDTENLVVRRK